MAKFLKSFFLCESHGTNCSSRAFSIEALLDLKLRTAKLAEKRTPKVEYWGQRRCHHGQLTFRRGLA